MSGRWILSVVVVGFLGLSVDAQQPDPFEKIRLQAQKLTAEVNDALARARALEGSDPVRAREILRDALIQVEDATVLAERERRTLELQLRNRIEALSRAIRIREGDKTGGTSKPVDKTPVEQPVRPP